MPKVPHLTDEDYHTLIHRKPSLFDSELPVCFRSESSGQPSSGQPAAKLLYPESIDSSSRGKALQVGEDPKP